MMKKIFLTVLTLLMSDAYARECKVFGISDSPQKLSCTFNNFKLLLSCRDGRYFLNNSRVSMAFHFEVEEGPVPLVFKAPDMQLTVMIESKIDILAELEKDKKILTGTCQ